MECGRDSVEAERLESGDEADREREEGEGEDGMPQPHGALHGDAGNQQLDDEDRERLGSEFPRQVLAGVRAR